MEVYEKVNTDKLGKKGVPRHPFALGIEPPKVKFSVPSTNNNKPAPFQQKFSDPPTKDELIQFAKDCRWEKEINGIEINGIKVDTSDRGKIMLAGARIKAEKDSEWSTKWNGILELNAAQIIAISDTVLDHVNNCFIIYGIIKSKIENGEITTPEEINKEFKGEE